MKHYLLLALFLFGCSGPQEVIYTNVTIYRDPDKPKQPYKEIGELSQEDFTGEDATVTRKFIERAQQRGADGLIILPTRDAGYKWDPFGRSGNRQVWRAILITEK